MNDNEEVDDADEEEGDDAGYVDMSTVNTIERYFKKV
jgi:hypothetical protein